MCTQGAWKAYDIRYRQTKGQKGVKSDDIPLDLGDGGVFGCASGPAADDNRADKNDVAFYRKLDENKKHVAMRPDDFFAKLVQWVRAQLVAVVPHVDSRPTAPAMSWIADRIPMCIGP